MMIIDDIRRALAYIDAHLDTALTVEAVAGHCHLSVHYFHRVFAGIVGSSPAAYIRARRIDAACAMIVRTALPLTEIALACGFGSQQAFNRAFRARTGMAPGAYRRAGIAPEIVTVAEMVKRCTNRMQGGTVVKPRIIRRPKLRVAGASGDGSRTGDVWMAFEALCGRTPLPQTLSEDGYEIRFTRGGRQIWRVHVGHAVPARAQVPPGYTVMTVPEATYAVFDVYVAQGYDSENTAMDQWLQTNGEGYRARLLDGEDYVIERYDERFDGEDAGSIVEIWVPVTRD